MAVNPTVAERITGAFTPTVDAEIYTPGRAGTDIGGSTGKHGYWRRPDGWICIHGMGASELRASIQVGRAPLVAYGEFDMANGRGGWNPQQDPYRWLLEHGGIGELPVDQVLQLGWHRTPHPFLAQQVQQLQRSGVSRDEAIRVVIPQLRGVELEDHPCILCPGRAPFNSEANLRSHEIIHREDVRQRELGRSIQDAILAAQAGNTQALLPLLKQMVENNQATQELMAALLSRAARDGDKG